MRFENCTTMSVQSPKSLLDADDFLRSVEMYLELLPELAPEFWGWDEPRKPFDATDLPVLIPDVEEKTRVRDSLPIEIRSTRPVDVGRPESVSWKRRARPKAYGSFSPRWGHGERAIHSCVHIDTEPDAIDQQLRTDFIKKIQHFHECRPESH